MTQYHRGLCQKSKDLGKFAVWQEGRGIAWWWVGGCRGGGHCGKC